MIIAVMDFETTGLDTKKCEIIELACCIYDWKQNKILKQYDALIKPTQPISEEITKITGITNEMLNDHGKHPGIVFGELAQFLFKDKDLMLENPEPIINFFSGHNSSNYDEIIFKRYIDGITSLQFMKEYKWIDTAHDLPYPKNVTCKKLTHLCYEYGYVMTNAHRAIFDCYGCVHLLSQFHYGDTINYIMTPNIRIVAAVKPPWLDDGKENAVAKEYGFRFDSHRKVWWRMVKENVYEDFKQNCPLAIVPEQLEMET